MKKKLIILLTLLSTFISYDNVKAAVLYEGRQFNRVGDYRWDGKFSDNNGEYDFALNNFLYEGSKAILFTDFLYDYNVDGTSTTAYCLDPSYTNPTKVKVERVLKENAFDSKIDSYDYGMYEILNKGYHESNRSYSFTYDGQGYSISGKDFEIATLIAVRAFNLGVFNEQAYGMNTNFKGMTSAAKNNASIRTSLYAKMGIKWGAELGDLTIKASSQCANTKDSLNTCLNNLATGRLGSLRDVELNPGETKGSDNWKIYYAARDLFGKGIKASAEYADGTSTTPSVEVRQGSLEKVSSSNNNVLNAEERTIEFKIKNFSRDGYVKNIKVVCEDCKENGVTISNYQYYNTSIKKWLPFNPNDNDINLANNIDSAGIAKIKFRTQRANANDDSCKPANYQIVFDEYDSSQETIAAQLKDANDKYAQRVLILVKNKVTSRTYSGIINCSKTTCPTTITNPVCETDGVANVEAPKDIKQCILNNTDDAGNSYQLTSENGGVSNPYCNVFCKEDYIDVFNTNGRKGGIELNTKINDVTCGSYFKLSAHIEGKKDCYTGGTGKDYSINKEKFVSDLNNAISNMVEAYNAYAKAKAALDHIDSALTGGEKRWMNTQNSWYISYKEHCSTSKDKDGKEVTSCSCIGSDTNRCSVYYVYGFEETGYQITEYDSNGIAILGKKTISYDYGGSGKDGGSNGSNSYPNCGTCTNGDPNVLRESIIDEYFTNEYVRGVLGDKNHAAIPGYYEKLSLGDLLSGYRNIIINIIKTYNSCSVGWTMDFPFAQQIGFDSVEYQERLKNPDDPFKYTNLIKDPSKKYLIKKDDTLQEEVGEKEYCYGTIKPDYSCEGKTTLSTPTYTKYNIRLCTESGCDSYLDESLSQVSDARYVKQTIKKGVDYITPSVFYQVYPTGAITAKNDYYGNSVQLKLLENGIPVSLSNYGGGNFYLIIQQLGEFYDTGELGRLMDFKGKNVERSVANAQKSNTSIEETFDGNYICNYTSKCYSPNNPSCPNCKFECVGENCNIYDCPECNITCVNCLFNIDKLQLNFKSVSTTNFLTGNREYGFNWAIDTNIKLLDLIAAKANTTIEEIKKANTTIFNGENVDTVSKDMSESNLEFSIKLTPKMIKDIRDYNDNVEQYGGYANDSLTCYDYKIGDKTYSNLLCYSDFLDDLFREYEGEGLIVAPRRATTASDVESTISARKNNPNNDSNNQRGYWTLWTQITDYKEELANGSVIGGPAWK